MDSPRVSVILVNWNGFSDTIECVKSLLLSNYENINIHVIDNNSSNESLSELYKADLGIEIFENVHNSGFGDANNIGAHLALAAGDEYIWILNNDTLVSPDAVEKLIEFSQSHLEIHLIGASIYEMHSKNSIQSYGCGQVDFTLGKARLVTDREELNRCDYVTGTSLFMKTRDFLALGGFDTTFFMYWEDTDLSFKARSKNMRLGIAVDAKIYHKESASSQIKSVRADKMFTSSSIKFFKRYSRNRLFLFGIVLRAFKRLTERRYINAFELVKILLSWRRI
jgi:GT2 family glycosyltransferase